MIFNSTAYLIVVGVTLCLAWLMFHLRRFRPHRIDMDQKNLLSTNFGFFTTLYTFFLGFAVVTLWSSFNDTDATVTNEAQMTMNLYRLSRNLPEADKFRVTLKDYAKSVIEDEWPMMDKQEMSPKTEDLSARLWENLLVIKPARLEDQSYYVTMINQLADFDRYRHHRLLQVDGNLYPPIWGLIFMGLFFSVLGFYFMDLDKNNGQLFFMFIMICMLLTNVYLIMELNKPFSGYLKVEPTAFKFYYKLMLKLP